MPRLTERRGLHRVVFYTLFFNLVSGLPQTWTDLHALGARARGCSREASPSSAGFLAAARNDSAKKRDWNRRFAESTTTPFQMMDARLGGEGMLAINATIQVIPAFRRESSQVI
jgi:hypothetical protein